VPVKEGLAAEHSSELLRDALPLYHGYYCCTTESYYYYCTMGRPPPSGFRPSG
jgi:hypothetical protein